MACFFINCFKLNTLKTKQKHVDCERVCSTSLILAMRHQTCFKPVNIEVVVYQNALIA